MWDFLLREGGEGWASQIVRPTTFFPGKNVEVSIFWLKWFSNFGLLIFNQISFPIKQENSETCWGERINNWRENIYPLNKNLIFWSNFRHKNSGAKFHCFNQKQVKHGEPRNLEVDPQSWHFVGWSCHEPCWVKSVTAGQKALVCELLGQITKTTATKTNNTLKQESVVFWKSPVKQQKLAFLFAPKIGELI